MTKADLQKELNAHGLDSSGIKGALVDKVVDFRLRQKEFIDSSDSVQQKHLTEANFDAETSFEESKDKGESKLQLMFMKFMQKSQEDSERRFQLQLQLCKHKLTKSLKSFLSI